MHLSELTNFYLYAKEVVVQNGFESEIQWQQSRDANTLSETSLLRELAWVCLCSGFRESVVRRLFGYISLCFCDWESADVILLNQMYCYQTASSVLNHPRKMKALIENARIIQRHGFHSLKRRILNDPCTEFRQFPYIGPVTAYHVAKNLGFQVAKPDRHLVRLAKSFGMEDVQMLCLSVSQSCGDPINVVDVVLWRFSTFRAHQFGESRTKK